MRPSTMGNTVMHHLGAFGIHWRHLPPRNASLHVVVILLRRRCRRSMFGSRNHRFWGGLVPTSSSRRGGRRRGRPGGFAPGMLSGTACGVLLLLLGGVAVALDMYVFPRLALLALGAVPLLVTLLATHTRCYRTGGSALLLPQQSWHSGLRRVRQQHCSAAWSPQQPPI